MKKLLSISFAALLLVSTIGITVQKHYCHSVLVATSLLPSVEDACDANMPMEEGSCSDEHQHFGVDSPLVLSAIAFDLTPSVEWMTANSLLLDLVTLTELPTSEFYADYSPPLSEPNIYTKVQSFLL
jgi:hypothetical protein